MAHHNQVRVKFGYTAASNDLSVCDNRALIGEFCMKSDNFF
ncbi:hypothetical protein BN1221_01650 [Brenneria goodwinii]|uniref:Uncharacterized protein n=1 Tax=Brenneria goodwinii TaxID=1109412 RepID=A0A0G4JTG9_9GAMM|nr:hypothetical protein BN1221_01650 [Brenneria goodwinii]